MQGETRLRLDLRRQRKIFESRLKVTVWNIHLFFFVRAYSGYPLGWMRARVFFESV